MAATRADESDGEHVVFLLDCDNILFNSNAVAEADMCLCAIFGDAPTKEF